MISLQVDTSQLDRARQLLASLPKAFTKAQHRTTKHVLKAMRAEAVRQSTALYYIKASTVRKAISTNSSSGMFTVRGRRLNIGSFHMTPKTRPKKQKGLSVAVRRDTGIKHIPKGFVIPGKNSGKMLGFIRVGKAREDIKPITSPAVPQLMHNPDVQEAILERGAEDFNKTFYFWVNKAIREGKL